MACLAAHVATFRAIDEGHGTLHCSKLQLLRLCVFFFSEENFLSCLESMSDDDVFVPPSRGGKSKLTALFRLTGATLLLSCCALTPTLQWWRW